MASRKSNQEQAISQPNPVRLPSKTLEAQKSQARPKAQPKKTKRRKQAISQNNPVRLQLKTIEGDKSQTRPKVQSQAQKKVNAQLARAEQLARQARKKRAIQIALEVPEIRQSIKATKVAQAIKAIKAAVQEQLARKAKEAQESVAEKNWKAEQTTQELKADRETTDQSTLRQAKNAKDVEETRKKEKYQGLLKSYVNVPKRQKFQQLQKIYLFDPKSNLYRKMVFQSLKGNFETAQNPEDRRKYFKEIEIFLTLNPDIAKELDKEKYQLKLKQNTEPNENEINYNKIFRNLVLKEGQQLGEKKMIFIEKLKKQIQKKLNSWIEGKDVDGKNEFLKSLTLHQKTAEQVLDKFLKAQLQNQQLIKAFKASDAYGFNELQDLEKLIHKLIMQHRPPENKKTEWEKFMMIYNLNQKRVPFRLWLITKIKSLMSQI